MIDLATWGYVGVLIAAAIPWLEILLVIPAGVALGLDPLMVGVVAYVGNAVPVVGIVLAFDALQQARQRRREHRAAGEQAHDEHKPSGRARRAHRLLDRYGLPVLALSGPAITGLHLAAAIATQTKAARGRVTAWMLGSLAAWTVVVTALSALGVDLVRG